MFEVLPSFADRSLHSLRSVEMTEEGSLEMTRGRRCEDSQAAHFERDFASAIRATSELKRSLRKGRLAAAAPKYTELIWIGKKDIQDN